MCKSTLRSATDYRLCKRTHTHTIHIHLGKGEQKRALCAIFSRQFLQPSHFLQCAFCSESFQSALAFCDFFFSYSLSLWTYFLFVPPYFGRHFGILISPCVLVHIFFPSCVIAEFVFEYVAICCELLWSSVFFFWLSKTTIDLDVFWHFNALNMFQYMCYLLVIYTRIVFEIELMIYSLIDSK